MVPKPDASASYNYSSLGFQAFQSREAPIKDSDRWLEDKKTQDGAEGLWRIYDGLYDFTDFIDKHPGGKFWLETTKGLDITEAFESHHITTGPEKLIKKYYVRQAKTTRNSPYTFAEDGFYKTLKRNAREVLKDIPKHTQWKSHIITDSLVVLSFIFSILACTFSSYLLGTVAGVIIASIAVAAHNYYHLRDNFRMYYSDLCMGSSKSFRTSHILSHHMYTNTAIDIQTYGFEPLLQFYPNKKSWQARYLSWVYAPLLVWPWLFHYIFIARLVVSITSGFTKTMNKTDLLPLILPSTMYWLSGQSLLATIGMWTFIFAIAGFWFNFIGNSTTHFHPDIFMDGDEPRPPEEMDWGISQLDTVSDRYEVMGNLFLVLVTFGDHAMHHLFPALDHSYHQYLYPVVQKTMKQFNLDIRMTSQMDMWGGYFKQLARDKPNPNPPNLFVNAIKKN